MKNTKKILAVATIGAIIAGTSMSFAADTTTTKVDREQIKTLMEKVKNGETLTDTEQETLDNAKQNFRGKGNGERGKHSGGRHMDDLTEAEKTALESMSDTEKKAFFETKRAEEKAQREARENVIDKLLAGETLTSAEETVRAEIIKERAERKAKHQEMEAKREEIKTLREKVKNGETLTAEEQATLDEMKTKHRGGDHRGEDQD